MFKLINSTLSKFGLKLTRKMVSLSGKEILFDDLTPDNTRTAILELVAKEINQNIVTGNIAELGVYQGNFAKYLNIVFPNKNLYLFDTFEGFDNRDIKTEINNFYSDGTQDFSNTSIDLVLSKMQNPENCIIKKGFFPETTKDLPPDIKFAFVSIDTDLFEPIYNGLQYFFPRLVNGGYIFIHDFNNVQYPGAKKAVLKFCSENKIPYLPIPDGWGTAIIMK